MNAARQPAKSISEPAMMPASAEPAAPKTPFTPSALPRATVVFFFVQSRDSRLCLSIRCHLYETKPLASSRVAVRDYLRAFDGSEFGEQLFQI